MSAVAGDLLVEYDADRTRLLDLLHAVQDHHGYLPKAELEALAEGLGTTYNDVVETASFYHLFHLQPAGRHRIYLADTVLARMHGYDEVLAALEAATGATLGEVSLDGEFGLFTTPCIGLSDQEPAMLADGMPFGRLTPERATTLIEALRAGRSARSLAAPADLAEDSREFVNALVESAVRTQGPVFFRQRPTEPAAVLSRTLALAPAQVIEELLESDLRGRGGAGFATGLKWRLCANAPGARRHVICNADEGEPGTFKDRVLLITNPELVFTGMVIAAHAIDARNGIVYLRGEYSYLLPFLNARLAELRSQGLLGRDIGGRAGFDFDIRIQLGAGAYVCGEESALIESCEGKRGTPRLKPPFPAQAGYLGEPTCIDNVESFATVTRIMEEGAHWFAGLGTDDSTGTRLLSVAGDCDRPGVYEVEWGTPVSTVLRLIGAEEAYAVQVGGPSGDCISAARNATRRLAFEDLACNGAFTVFGPERDLLDIVAQHLRFFVAESCGICAPCRIGNGMLLERVESLRAGRASPEDLDELVRWGTLVRRTSRCGLGATSPKPLLTTLEAFPAVFESKLKKTSGTLLPSFDRTAALADYAQVAAQLTGPTTSRGTDS